MTPIRISHTGLDPPAAASAASKARLARPAAVLSQVVNEDWERPTPCAGWTAHDLLGHLASTVWSAISMMQGLEPTWPDPARPGDLVEGDPVEFWGGTVLQARQVLTDAELTRPMESPLGHTVADALAIPVIDLYVHAWDLAATINLVIDIPPP